MWAKKPPAGSSMYLYTHTLTHAHTHTGTHIHSLFFSSFVATFSYSGIFSFEPTEGSNCGLGDYSEEKKKRSITFAVPVHQDLLVHVGAT